MSRFVLLAAAAIPAAACQGAAVSTPALQRSEAGLEQAALTIHSGNHAHQFVVEIARTLEEQSYGLMNRTAVAPDRGMIFPYDPPEPVAFWMKNTLIPLDMIFIAPGGRILRIEPNTTPLSLEPVPSGGPIEAVLELAGGRSAELGIKAGDKVDWQR